MREKTLPPKSTSFPKARAASLGPALLPSPRPQNILPKAGDIFLVYSCPKCSQATTSLKGAKIFGVYPVN